MNNVKFAQGMLCGVVLCMIVYTVRINLNPETKSKKMRIHIDGNFCKVEEIQ